MRSCLHNFVALSIFEVKNDLISEVKDAFINRPKLVENAEGFIKLDVISPLENPKEIWLLTYWETEDHFNKWHKSHLRKDSHNNIPKGLKLVPTSTQLKFFEHVTN